LNILVTGGAGYIGSHVCKKLAQNGYNPIVIDNLTRGNKWAVKWGPLEIGDILDSDFIERVMKKYAPVSVMHFAALAYVGESVNYPNLYYNTNVTGTLNLLDAMIKFNISKIIFSSSCATFGIPKRIPIQENDEQNPINPYGFSKLIIEKLLEDYFKAHKISSVSLRYFNAIGADKDAEIGEVHNPETHLVPSAFNVAIGRMKSIDIYGNDYDTDDGYCIRDYIHVDDLAAAHILSLEYLDKGNTGSYKFNLGTGRGFSVMEVIKTIKKITNKKINFNIVSRRDGDPPELVAAVKGAHDFLKWRPQITDLSVQINDAWAWHKKYFG